MDWSGHRLRPSGLMKHQLAFLGNPNSQEGPGVGAVTTYLTRHNANSSRAATRYAFNRFHDIVGELRHDLGAERTRAPGKPEYWSLRTQARRYDGRETSKSSYSLAHPATIASDVNFEAMV